MGDERDFNNDSTIDEIVTKIKLLGDEIRDLKPEAKRDPGLKPVLDDKIKKLVELKLSLPLGHNLRPEERLKQVKTNRETRRSKPAHRLLPDDDLRKHRVQRKIHNVFAPVIAGSDAIEDDQSGSENSESSFGPNSFRLNPSLLNSDKTGLDFDNAVVIATEKWDGTTVQATNEGIFKRKDQIARGDERKHSASETERYSLIELDIFHPSNKRFRQAIEPHLNALRKIPPGMTIYFECCGPKIQNRFKSIKIPGVIRVFDSSRNGEYLPFDETIALCEDLGLPIVHHFTFSTPGAGRSAKDLITLIQSAASENRTYSNASDLGIDVPLEGYVFRDAANGNNIGKFRVTDLPLLGRQF